MEKKDEELIQRILPEDEELRELMRRHRQYETQLEEFNKRVYLTSEETLERKKLQKLKLAGRDRIEQILADYRRREQKS